MKKGEIEHKRNHQLQVIHKGFALLIWCIDYLHYDYMIDWRNQLSKWQTELESRYKWLKNNI